METHNFMDEALEIDFYFDLEKSWRESLPRLSDIQWLDVFPEARGILADKVKEWNDEKQRLIGVIKWALQESSRESIQKYALVRLYAQALIVPRINDADKHIARLRRQQAHFAPRSVAGRITDADIQRAKEVPIASLISTKLRQAGKTLTTNCPLHKDRTPSFVIYKESNTCWCFGCQQGGDSIALVRLLNNLSFIEAVKYLQRL